MVCHTVGSVKINTTTTGLLHQFILPCRIRGTTFNSQTPSQGGSQIITSGVGQLPLAVALTGCLVPGASNHNGSP